MVDEFFGYIWFGTVVFSLYRGRIVFPQMKPIIYTITVHDYDTLKNAGGFLCPKLW